ASKQKIIDYLAVIEAGMARKMGADSGYSGLLTKNPCHMYWRTTIWTREAYELNYLADFVDLKPLTQKEQGTGLGRNCTSIAGRKTHIVIKSLLIDKVEKGNLVEKFQKDLS
ncbi:replication initiation protein, partial [Klebsiella variicola]|uniref:replication initiation protein n=1 Tax=Klebsiella variicola TaxID=244366 RepID=UPI001C452872